MTSLLPDNLNVLHTVSTDGLTLISELELPDGKVNRITVSWKDIETAKANYEQAKNSHKEVLLGNNKKLTGKGKGGVISKNYVRVFKLFGRSVSVGYINSNEFDEGSIAFGRKKLVIGSTNGKLDFSKRQVKPSSGSSDRFTFGAGGLHKAAFIAFK